MTTDNERFLHTYNQLDEWMRAQLGAAKHIPHATMIDQLAGKNSYVRKYQSRLHAFRALRNALTHWTAPTEGTAIAEPHNDVVQEYLGILSELQQPPKALSQAITEVYSVTWETPVLEALQIMVPRYWRLAPVLEDGILVGLFDVDSALRLIRDQLERDGQIALDTSTTFARWRELIAFSPDNPSNRREGGPFVHGVVLMDEHQTTLHAEALFSEWFARRELLSVVCITPKGQAFEPLLGIITAHDVTGWSAPA